jgi:hypothetical protein
MLWSLSLFLFWNSSSLTLSITYTSGVKLKCLKFEFKFENSTCFSIVNPLLSLSVWVVCLYILEEDRATLYQFLHAQHNN